MAQKTNTMSDIAQQGFFERFVAQISPEPNSGCWIWTGWTSRYGYGGIKFNRKRRCAHRVSYECYRGPIPIGLEPDHLCRVTLCVNPDHLELVTKAENIRRAHMAHRKLEHRSVDVCKKGHPWTPETITTQSNGSRACLICKREYDREFRRKWRLRKQMIGVQ